MNYFYLKIFGLVLFIIAVSYWNTYCNSFIESFSLNSSNKNININGNECGNKTIVLLGDSILKNNSYVSNGKGVDNILEERNANVVSLAENNSKIIDVYGQIGKIPLDINNVSTSIFLSSGGNDILFFYVDQHGDTTDTGFLNTMMAAYKKLVKSIQTRMNKCQIVLVDIYYPVSNPFAQYKPIIEEWNTLISNYARENSFGLLQISQSVTSSDDFTLGIEPSEKGGEKIAQLILHQN
jgi:lysophospholipase L1-like esterase